MAVTVGATAGPAVDPVVDERATAVVAEDDVFDELPQLTSSPPTATAAVIATVALRGRADGRGRGPSGPLAEGEQERTGSGLLRFSAR